MALTNFGIQKPPSDPRIFNRQQEDGSYRSIQEFFDPIKSEGCIMTEKTTVERLVIDIRLLEDNVRNSEYFAAETQAEEVTSCLMILETDALHFGMKVKK